MSEVSVYLFAHVEESIPPESPEPSNHPFWKASAIPEPAVEADQSYLTQCIYVSFLESQPPYKTVNLTC